ncbi:MAG TPA: hypothetical protein VJ023_19710 [Pyrinomonadaceae bacterium]|nr:hypothetical protein [Pyrinomonadaceae bacterium]
MRKLIWLLMVASGTLVLALAQTEQSKSNQFRYPNELPSLKLYEKAKWKSLTPYVSNIDDVEKLLGQPVPIFDRLIRADFGFQYDPDWTIVINVLGKDSDLMDSVAGRVLHVNLYPKKRVSMVNADFSAFRAYTYRDSRYPNLGGIVYADSFGLRYSVYAKDTADGRFLAGDLESIIYGPSNEETAKYRRKMSTTRQ